MNMMKSMKITTAPLIFKGLQYLFYSQMYRVEKNKSNII